MARFAFRLERLLDVRRLREEAAARDLGLARRAREERDRAAAALVAEIEALKDARRRLQARAALDGAELRRLADAQADLQRRLEGELRRREELAGREEERRRAWSEARKGVRVLERFRERRLRERARDEGRREQRILDEAARAPERS